jgi:uncharacterized protein YbbK (DUF523 family)
MIRVLVSACLMGERVRYDGRDAAPGGGILQRWLAEGRVVAFCPEVAGGLGVPRPAAEIAGGDGAAVLDGKARVVTQTGDDVTAAFVRGAERALQAAQSQGVALAVLKEGSPSCGSGLIHDGSFEGGLREAMGVTTALFERHGIPVFSERTLAEADERVRALESGGETDAEPEKGAAR